MRAALVIAMAFLMTVTASAQRRGSAPAAELRAAYLATNPAQAIRDPATGELRGVAVDMAREFARTRGMGATLVAAQSPQAVIEAVRDGKADIGFVAYNPERAGPVEFSQPYLLVQQTFLVRDGSSVTSVRELDRPDQRIAARSGDSIALHLARTLQQARLVELTEAETRDAPQMLLTGAIDAFGANRQRLSGVLAGVSGLRLLSDDLYGVEQAIIVPKGSTEALNSVNRFIDDVRRSGFLRASIERSGVVGIAIAPRAP